MNLVRPLFVAAFVLCALSVAGCGDDDGSPPADAGPGDSGMMMMPDGGMMMPDGGMMMMPDGGMMMPDGGMMMPDTGMPDGGVMAPANDTCATAEVLADPGAVAGTTAGAVNDYGDGDQCSGTAGGDVVYTILVPAGQRLTATVSTTDGWDPSISLATSTACGVAPRVCLDGSDSGGTDESDTVSYLNTGSDDVIAIVIDSYSATMSGAFTLETMFSAPMMGDDCAMADVLAPTGGAGTTTGFGDDFSGGSACSSASGPDHVYSFTIPADRALMVTATPDAAATDFDLTLHIVAGPSCTSVSDCLASDDSAGGGSAETVVYSNTTGADLDVFVIVDGYSSDDAGDYTLDVATIMAGPGDTCLLADTLTPGTPVTSTTVDLISDFTGGADCRGADGPDRFYSVTVPAGMVLSATATPDAAATDFDVSVHVIAGPAAMCMPASDCLASADSAGGGGADSIRYTNTSGADEEVFVIVDGYNTDDFGAFTLTATVSPPPPGETCADATMITAGTEMGTTVGYTSDYGSSGTGCVGASGGDRVYSIALPDTQELQINLTPEAGFDIAVNLVTEAACDPDAPVCVASADVGFGGGAEMVSYRNTSGGMQNVFIVIDGFGSTGGTFSLQTMIVP